MELALALWHSCVEIVVVHADSINAKAASEEVQVAVHPAMLDGLPDGPVPKTMRVFAILKRGHYYLASTKIGDRERAMFNVGKDADEAQASIVAFLTNQRGTLGQLAVTERRKQIKAIIRAGTSWAAVAGATPAAGQKNAALVTATVKPAKSNTLCKNFEKDGNCKYGEGCSFVHDDSRMARNKRQRNQTHPITVVKEKDQQSTWQQVPSRQRLLKVWCRPTVHPASWRSSLQSINPAAYELVNWAERSVADEEWLTVQCHFGEEEKLAKLLAQDFKIKQQLRRPNSGNRTHQCADFLNGGDCGHPFPYCK